MHITTSYNIHNKSLSSIGLVTPIQIYYYETLLEKWVPPTKRYRADFQNSPEMYT